MARVTVKDWDEDEPHNGEADDTIPCPHCHRLIHEDSPQCPHCQNWISEEDEEQLPEEKPAWIVITTLVCLLLVILWILGH